MKTWMINWKLAQSVVVIGMFWFTSLQPVSAYPPGVGILGKARDCMACHASDGPWQDDGNLIADLLDKETGKSLRQKDGSFLITAKPEQSRTVLVVLGRANGEMSEVPTRNGWIFVDPTLIERDFLGSKFAPGWDADLNMSCRLTGDNLEAYKGAKITVLPMKVRPSGAAKDTEIEWQFLLSGGVAVKGDSKQGLIQNYFFRKVWLKVEE